ncbi:MAG: hypothetical protein ACD_37C00100G0002 [uncultured bacterium]|nr:MAG: hypothetical protein ACD_37C00100G0002 [uncultured bacterium]
MNSAGEKFESLLDTIYLKISAALTEEDIKELERLDLEDQSGQKVERFLLSRFPNLFNLVQEEVEKFKQEQKIS